MPYSEFKYFTGCQNTIIIIYFIRKQIYIVVEDFIISLCLQLYKNCGRVPVGVIKTTFKFCIQHSKLFLVILYFPF